MFPDVHVNLDRPTIQHIYQLFLPFVPGFTLVIGLGVAHPNFASHMAAIGLGYYSRIVVMVFIAYAVGLILHAASLYFGATVSLSMTALYSKVPKWRPFRNNLVISQNRVWRTVAATFLGNQLIPKLPIEPGSELTTTALDFSQAVPPRIAPPSVLQHDAEWNDWYNILQDYVLRGTPILPNEAQFVVSIIQSTSWAFVILSLQSGLGRHWGALFALVPVILLSALISFAVNYNYHKYDRLTGADFTSRLLAEIRTRGDMKH
jgi:hypothetical protein